VPPDRRVAVAADPLEQWPTIRPADATDAVILGVRVKTVAVRLHGAASRAFSAFGAGQMGV